MVTTPHALLGATIATIVPNPFLSLPLSLASHFVLDTVPHWQETLYPYTPHKGTWIRICIDFSLALLLVAFIAKEHQNIQGLIWANAFTANIPDTDTITILKPALVKYLPLLKRFTLWHTAIQHETSSLWGIVPQVLLIVLCLLIALR